MSDGLGSSIVYCLLRWQQFLEALYKIELIINSCFICQTRNGSAKVARKAEKFCNLDAPLEEPTGPKAPVVPPPVALLTPVLQLPIKLIIRNLRKYVVFASTDWPKVSFLHHSPSSKDAWTVACKCNHLARESTSISVPPTKKKEGYLHAYDNDDGETKSTIKQQKVKK